ncbi:rho GTPase-activating protein [Pleurotus pulmonarius]|nr:rho GTPase-activating protein [Pleurotus pulmonarius]KAF4600196.1 rho GTPase-activating protein [Pleurotus pulmonarius]
MAPRRGAPSLNTLSPQDSASSTSAQQSPAFLGLPRSASPSSGFTQFLSRPSKWFNRSVSTSKITHSTSEPRSSTSSSGRKHKISRPTDPRPILDQVYGGGGSRSVLDLSSRHPGSLDIPNQPVPPSPSTPTGSSGGLGDLRTISRRGWSRSADDLGKMSPTNLSPINTNFQDKVAQYRGRSDSSASGVSPSTPSSPASLINGRQPFPMIKPPVSVSPPRSSTLPMSVPPLTVSRSADESSIVQPPHVHTRSHSFTPKLSSKLAAPRFGPPSPVRKGSGSSERDFPIIPKDLDKSILGKPFTTEPTRSTTLLAPPLIIEPKEATEPVVEDVVVETKRSSQIVYHSGFINRLTEANANFFRHPPDLSSDRGWKPFKLELKGSKLYFYKPPGDRSAAVKALFPSELVPADQEIEEPEEHDVGGASLRPQREGDGTMGRKKRAYWGRTKHPELTLDSSGRVIRGSFEALVHETVFAATFFIEASDGQQTNPQERWKDFATSVLLWIPDLVNRSKFETEFTRCCGYLINGASDEKRESERDRVLWLAQEYLRCHGEPFDSPSWEEWRSETLPGASLVVPIPSSTLPTSFSAQAIYAPTPLLSNESPDLGTFSPRPDGGIPKVASLMDALGMEPPRPTPSSPSSKSGLDQRTPEPHSPYSAPSPRQTKWNALRMEGLSRSVLSTIDPRLLAQSLTLFHRSILEQIPENLTVGLILSNAADNEAMANLFGSNDHPHWLTKLILLQILGPDSGTTTNPSQFSPPGLSSDDHQAHTSRTHSRSEAISTWTRIGELCRSAGDECSWRAIADALRSQAVARLEKVWKRVDPHALAAVETWVYPDADGEWVGIKEPRVTPWGGTIRDRIKQALDGARDGTDAEGQWRLEALDKAKQLYEKIRTSFSLCPRRATVGDGADDDLHSLVTFWRDMSSQRGGHGGQAVKFQRVDQFMSLSLAAEPRRKGLFEPHYWTRPPHSYSTSTVLVPLIFPEPLPTLSLIDRSSVLRGRQDSDPTDLQYIRLEDRKGHHRSDIGGWDFAGIKRGGTVIPVFGGELVLVVRPAADPSASLGSRPPSQAPSRPPSSVVDASPGEKSVSRAPSIRVKPGSSQNLERKTSMARRNSLPAISQRQDIMTISEPSTEPPLRVLVQAATLNALVQILVHGLNNVSVSVADDNGEMALKEGKTRELFMDYGEFSTVWWRVFRSFVTPLVFFELLRKLYISFQPQTHEAKDYFVPIRKRSEVIQTLSKWITDGGGAQDILDDPQLFNSMKSFLESETDHTMNGISNCDDGDVANSWSSLLEERTSLGRDFHLQSMRPKACSPQPRGSVARMRNVSSREPPNLDQVTAEELVEDIDGMAFAAFSTVTDEDLFISADLLEVQTADRIGWFSQRELPTSEEVIEIQTIYSHFQEVEPSSLISEMTHDSFYRLLPPGVRSCIRAYTIIRKWLISKIVSPRLGARARQARLELLLQTIEVARLRSFCLPSASNLPLADRPCTRSFVETVVTSALLSIESRMYHRVWQNIASQRGCQCDSLSSLLSKSPVDAPTSRRSLIVDIGWLMERMLEIIALPDVLDSAPIPGNLLVNYDKRRHLCNLIADAPTSSRAYSQRDNPLRRGLERLNNIEREAVNLQFDYRAIKEEAQREAAQMPVSGSASARKVSRPFQRLVMLQSEKYRRDKTLRLRLQKEKAQEQAKNEKRDDILTKAMRPRKPPSSAAQKQHRNKKSMSAFLQFMRPISSAFGADIQPTSLKRSPAELDFVPSGKPTHVISLVDTRTAQYINQSRSFTFQLDTEDGGHYLLQAMNRQDMVKWMETINRVAKIAAKRRLTYLGSALKPQPSDHIHDHPKQGSVDPTAVFGVDLEVLLRREASGDEPVPAGTIPKAIQQCLHEVESRGLTEVGIYRIAGASSEINSLKDAFNRGENPINPDTDIHAVCDLIKTWFRLLPEPIFPSSAYYDIIEAMQLEDLDARLTKIREVVQGLPTGNFDILKRVAEHLDKVTDYEESNQMTAEGLAIVFSPNLLRAPHNNFVMILANMGHTHKLVKALITHFHTIFDEADPEVDADQDEYDSPIMEEDEEDESNDDKTCFTSPTQESDHSTLNNGS